MDYQVNMLTKTYIITDPKTIKKRLIDLGISQADIANELSVSRAAVSRVISGRSKSKKILNYLILKLELETQANDSAP